MASIRDERIARTLRRLRGNLTSAEVHRATGILASKLSRIENQTTRPKPEDIERLATFYGADRATIDLLLREASRAGESVWWSEFVGDNWSNELNYHLELEQDAVRLDSWTNDLVPGLLQRPPYATALITGRSDVPADQLAQRLEFRARRRARVESGELTVWAIISESALYTLVGGPEGLSEQLQYLANPAENVTVQIMPFSAGAHDGLGSGFHILRFSDWPAILYQETVKKGLYEDDPNLVAEYGHTMDNIRATALSPAASRDLLLQRVDELGGSNAES